MPGVEKHEKALHGVEKQINQNGANLATLKLLEIQGLRNVSSVGQITAYKPTYDLNTAKNALDTTGMFEGPMSVFSLDSSPLDCTTDMMITGVHALTWKSLEDIMPVFDMVEQIKTRLHDESFLVKRTIFPVTLASALQDQDCLQLEKNRCCLATNMCTHCICAYSRSFERLKKMMQTTRLKCFGFFSAL